MEVKGKMVLGLPLKVMKASLLVFWSIVALNWSRTDTTNAVSYWLLKISFYFFLKQKLQLSIPLLPTENFLYFITLSGFYEILANYVFKNNDYILILRTSNRNKTTCL